MADVTFNGMTMEFSVLESRMDNNLKQQIKQENPDSDEQELLDIYLYLHKEEFDKDFLQ